MFQESAKIKSIRLNPNLIRKSDLEGKDQGDAKLSTNTKP